MLPARSQKVLAETPRIKVSKQGSKYFITLKDRGRYLQLNVDQLFDVAEALDDICDEIEDRDSRKKQSL